MGDASRGLKLTKIVGVWTWFRVSVGGPVQGHTTLFLLLLLIVLGVSRGGGREKQEQEQEQEQKLVPLRA